MTGSKQWVRLYRLNPPYGVEIVHAYYVEHRFARHSHEHYVVGLVEEGVQQYTYRGATHTTPPGQLIAKSIPLEKKFFALADRYVDSRDKDVRNLALALLKHFEKFFALLRNQGVEPTNNSAERALRRAVQWRKVSFGSRSAQGEIAVARLLTVTRTCRMQNREPLDYLGTAIRSHRNVQPVPSLLKTAPTT
jgi:hypothetical protein